MGCQLLLPPFLKRLLFFFATVLDEIHNGFGTLGGVSQGGIQLNLPITPQPHGTSRILIDPVASPAARNKSCL